MAQLNFPTPDPNVPSTLTYTEAGITWTWNEDLQLWSSETEAGGGGSTSVSIGLTPPPDAVAGDLWWNNDFSSGQLFIYYQDPNSSQWVEASPQGSSTKLDVSSTPPSDAKEGDLWWNNSDNSGRLYVYYEDDDSSQWVEASPQGLSKDEGDGLYLSKINNDTAAGAITFESITTHAIGLAATTGSIHALNGGVVSGGNPVGGVADGARLVQTGILSVSRTESSSPLFNAYKTGTTEPVIKMWNDGRAYFSGDVDIEAPFTSGDASNPLLTFARPGGAVKGVTGYDASVPAIYTGTVTPHKFQIRVNNNIAQTINTDSSVNFAGDTETAGKIRALGSSHYFAGSTRFGSDVRTDFGNSNQDVGVGIIGSSGTVWASNANGPALSVNRNNTGGAISFKRQGVQVGTINVQSDGVVLPPPPSDYRLKENMSSFAVGSATEKVNQLKPTLFSYKSDEKSEIIQGFIAHEVAEVVPYAVKGKKDEVDEGGNPVYQGVWSERLIPLLTKALQETIAKNEELEARLAALEGA